MPSAPGRGRHHLRRGCATPRRRRRGSVVARSGVAPEPGEHRRPTSCGDRRLAASVAAALQDRELGPMSTAMASSTPAAASATRAARAAGATPIATPSRQDAVGSTAAIDAAGRRRDRRAAPPQRDLDREPASASRPAIARRGRAPSTRVLDERGCRDDLDRATSRRPDPELASVVPTDARRLDRPPIAPRHARQLTPDAPATVRAGLGVAERAPRARQARSARARLASAAVQRAAASDGRAQRCRASPPLTRAECRGRLS